MADDLDYDLIVIGAGGRGFVGRDLGGGKSVAHAITMGRVARITIGHQLKAR